VAGLKLAGYGLGGAQRHEAWLLDGPAPATEVQGEAGWAGLLELEGTRTTTRRMGQQRDAEAMGWMARNTGPNAPPQRPGKGAAGACVSPCARRGGWGSAGEVLPHTWLRLSC